MTMVWPKLQLTEYEREHVDIYPDGKKPGVRRHIYRRQLANIAQPDLNVPEATSTQILQISRRARVFAIMFSGQLDMWRLSVRNASGTSYINPSPRSQKFPLVASLVAGSTMNAAANGNVSVDPDYRFTPSVAGVGMTLGAGFDVGYQRSQPFAGPTQSMPWCIEPNWVLAPNETLIFQGEPVDVAIGDANHPEIAGLKLATVLNISVYVWEFPDFPADHNVGVKPKGVTPKRGRK